MKKNKAHKDVIVKDNYRGNAFVLPILAIFFILLSLQFVSSKDFAKYNEQINFKKPCIFNNTYCAPSTQCNVTLFNPQYEVIVDNKPMTNNSAYYNYTFNNQTILGTYKANMVCSGGGLSGSNTFDIEITGNGKEKPDGIVIVLFSLIFLAIAFFLVYMTIYNVGHFANLDLDIIDVAFNLGGYVVLIGVVMLHNFYVGNPDMRNILEWVIGVTGITNILIPFMAFFVTLIYQTVKRKRVYNGL